MQNQSVNEVVANNSNYTPMRIQRITAADYEHMAEYICAEVRPLERTFSGTWGNLEFEISAWGLFETRTYFPEDVIYSWVECHTVDDDGEEIMNDFCIQTLREYIDDYIRECDDDKYYPEFS